MVEQRTEPVVESIPNDCRIIVVAQLHTYVIFLSSIYVPIVAFTFDCREYAESVEVRLKRRLSLVPKPGVPVDISVAQPLVESSVHTDNSTKRKLVTQKIVKDRKIKLNRRPSKPKYEAIKVSRSVSPVKLKPDKTTCDDDCVATDNCMQFVKCMYANTKSEPFGPIGWGLVAEEVPN